MKKLIVIGIVVLLVAVWAMGAVQADSDMYVALHEGTDIWTKPPGMGGVVVGHLPIGYHVTVLGVIGIEPNAWAKIDIYGYWVRYNQLTDTKWEPE